MYLIFVHYLGKDHAKQHNYELIFTEFEDKNDVEGDGWNAIPAAGNVEPPLNYSDKVVLIKTIYQFELIQDNDFFGMSHVKRGIIPLAWTEDSFQNIILHYYETEEQIFKKIKQ
jgi:hypothetical protein